MALSDRLLQGQVSDNDRIPMNYASPTGSFQGKGYESKDGVVLPVYEKVAGTKQPMMIPNMFSLNETNRRALNNFIISQYSSFTVPVEKEGNWYIGLHHKLSNLEYTNKKIAYRGNQYLPLSETEVGQLIKKHFIFLEGSTTKPNAVQYTNLAIKDNNSGITIMSFKYGITPSGIKELFNLDVNNAINRIQRLVKVPVNFNQLMALISLAYELGDKMNQTTGIIHQLNKNNYAGSVSYFMDHATYSNDYDTIRSGDMVNRRSAEAELFSTI